MSSDLNTMTGTQLETTLVQSKMIHLTIIVGSIPETLWNDRISYLGFLSEMYKLNVILTECL